MSKGAVSAAGDLPVTTGLSRWKSNEMQRRVAKRYASERRFRGVGLFAVLLSAGFLAFLLLSMLLGGVRVKVFKRTQRCPATEVNPDTAERDAKPQKWLRDHYGHADMGVYAEVLEGGTVAVGDALEPVQADLLG